MSNYFAFKASAAAGSGGYFSTGTIIPWTTTTQADLPGFLICDGTAYSRATYAALFAVIGINYGHGDGDPSDISVGSTFNVPNFQQKVMLGQDGNANYTIGDSGGANTNTPTIVFGSATVNVTSNDDFAVGIDSANVDLPAHNHLVAKANNSFNQGTTDVTANTTVARFRRSGTPVDQLHYQLGALNGAADVGKTSTAGSGNGSHNHGVNFNGSVTSSFNQSNISANANAVNIIQPYQTVTFMIKT
tara:strand:+ start:4494 stop:5231 length:738 start_codon:yes stop_codon:yes gene_type:complete